MTTHYILPNFYDNYLHNKTIIEKLIQKRDICGVSGTFPLSIFNGSYNNIYGEQICLYDNIKNILQNYSLLSEMVIIDYGNPLLEPFDYYDLYNKIILEEYAHNSNCYFAVSKIDFIDYLIEKYPNINIILHQNYTREHTSEEIQKTIDNYTNIKGIITSSFNICTKVKNIFKIYLLPIHTCEECLQYKKCLHRENVATLEFSGQSEFSLCSLRKLVNPDNIIGRIKFMKEHCDYIMFDTVVCSNALEEYTLIETVIEQMEEE